MNPHFASLVVGLAAQAESALAGTLPAEASKEDPRQIARMLIDTLSMLEEKTSGRLEEDEKQLLSQALTGLKFRFVQVGGAK